MDSFPIDYLDSYLIKLQKNGTIINGFLGSHDSHYDESNLFMIKMILIFKKIL